MKKLLLAILIVCVFVLPVFAQYQAPPVSEKDVIEFVADRWSLILCKHR